MTAARPPEDGPAKAAAEARAERKPCTQEEVKAFLTGITGERLYAACLLSLMSLRPAEVCGLRWSDVDFEAVMIAARDNTQALVDGEIEEKEAKSAAGKRGLPMPPTVTKRSRRSTPCRRRSASVGAQSEQARPRSGW